MILVTLGALIAGLAAGIVLGLATVGLLPFVVGGTLECSVNGDGTVTTCTNGSGEPVKVPHHIHITR